MEISGLSALQRDILYVTANEEQQPTPAIRTELEDYYPTSVADSQLYPALQELVEQEFLRKRECDGRTDAYRVTEQGTALLTTHHKWKTERRE